MFEQSKFTGSINCKYYFSICSRQEVLLRREQKLDIIQAFAVQAKPWNQFLTTEQILLTTEKFSPATSFRAAQRLKNDMRVDFEGLANQGKSTS
jgi:hypothetical protein